MDSIISNAFRWVLWLFTHFALVLVDNIYDIIIQFVGLDIGDFEFIWDFYAIVIAATGLFVLARIAIIVFQGFWDDSRIQKIGGGELVNRVIGIALVLSLIPVIMPMISKFAADSASLIPSIYSTSDVVPSDIIIEGGLADFESGFSQTVSLGLETGQHAVDVITLKNINEMVGEDYLYFSNTSNILLTMILAVFSAYVFIYIAVQIVQRLVGLLLKIIMAPYPLSGLIDPNDNGPSLWFRLCMSDFLAAYFQMMTIWLALVFTTNLPDSLGGLAKGLAFIGAIFSIMVAPSGIAQLLGNDTGAQAGMQMMQSAMMLGHGVQTATHVASTALHVGESAARAALHTGANGVSTGYYTFGRMLGGRSMNTNNIGASGGTGGTDGIAESFSGIGGNTGYDPTGPKGVTDIGGTSLDTAQRVGTEPTAFSSGGLGYAIYDDGRVTNPDSFLGRHSQPHSVAGAVAQTFARHMYQRAGARVTNTGADRQAMKAARTLSDRVHGFSSGVHDYKSTVAARTPRHAVEGQMSQSRVRESGSQVYTNRSQPARTTSQSMQSTSYRSTPAGSGNYSNGSQNTTLYSNSGANQSTYAQNYGASNQYNRSTPVQNDVRVESTPNSTVRSQASINNINNSKNGGSL